MYYYSKRGLSSNFFFFFNDTATTEIYTLSLHDALPICVRLIELLPGRRSAPHGPEQPQRSEEHTSELQSPLKLVCRLLLEKKKTEQEHGSEFYNTIVTLIYHNRQGTA